MPDIGPANTDSLLGPSMNTPIDISKMEESLQAKLARKRAARAVGLTTTSVVSCAEATNDSSAINVDVASHAVTRLVRQNVARARRSGELRIERKMSCSCGLTSFLDFVARMVIQSSSQKDRPT